MSKVEKLDSGITYLSEDGKYPYGFKPIFSRVLIKRAVEDKSKGGIIIPENSRKNLSKAKGLLLACGEDCCEAVANLVGKNILFGEFAGNWLRVGEQEYFLCDEGDIYGEIN